MKTRKNIPTALALFSGCGGFTEGFRLAGIRTVAANDVNPAAADTFRHNHPGTQMITGDIGAETTQNLLYLAATDCDIIVGGPPCQSFSMAGLRDPDDPRGKLFQDYFKLVRRLNPAVCVAENVKGILSMKSGGESVFGWICEAFSNLGYDLACETLDAVWYGVPQHRERVIFIASKKGRPSWPRPTHGRTAKLPFVTTKGSLEELSHIYTEHPEWSHIFTNHSDEFLEKIKNTKPGESVTSFKGAFWRLKPDEPSKTVMANNGSCFIHYDIDRVLTPREMAVLQGFGHHYRFCGSKYDQLVQIGNAVPVGLAKAIGDSVLRLL
jgi:DNA (cytosine-5)-methyltransferase 1